MFEQITAFLPKFKEKGYGKWVRAGRGFLKKQSQPPHVVYSETVREFESAVFEFAEEHGEMGLTDYSGVLGEAGVSPDFESLKAADVSEYDGRTVMALLVGAIRAERFCDGALLGALESGLIQKWLGRLVEIDEEK